MTAHFQKVEACVAAAAETLAGMELSAEYEYRLRRDILGKARDPERLDVLRQQVLSGAMLAEVTAEQLPNGGWARFGTEDMTVKKNVPTTAFAVRRLLWLGLTREDEPLSRALDYLVDIFEGRRKPPEGGEVNERWPEVLRIRAGNLIAMIDPYEPCLDDLMERWRFIAENTFHDGVYDYAVCKDLQATLLNIQGRRLIPIPLQLLVCRRGFLSERMERILLDYCWQRHLEGFLLWPDGKLDVLPECFRNSKTSRHMSTMESMVCFRNSSRYLAPAVEWLLGGREEDGLWDYGPQAVDPFGYTRKLAAPDWRKPVNRKLDCTMEALALLMEYIRSNG